MSARPPFLYLYLMTLAGLLFATGVTVWFSGWRLPVYNEPDAMNVVLEKIEGYGKLDHSKEKSRAWYAELEKLETSHKPLTDLGRGLMSFAVGLVFVAFFLRLLFKIKDTWRIFFCALSWLILWVLQIPLTFFYYTHRASRGDYPLWADSIVIPIFQGTIVAALGSVISFLILVIFMIGFTLPSTIKLRYPVNPWQAARVIVLWLWILLLVVIVITGVMDGAEFVVLPCLGAIPLLLLVLSATPKNAPPLPTFKTPLT